jgi:cobalamin biosynthesis protein CobD/CbiB
VLIILHSSITKRSVLEAYKIWRRNCKKTDSVNAGHLMATMAGALGVELETLDFTSSVYP